MCNITNFDLKQKAFGNQTKKVKDWVLNRFNEANNYNPMKHCN